MLRSTSKYLSTVFLALYFYNCASAESLHKDVLDALDAMERGKATYSQKLLFVRYNHVLQTDGILGKIPVKTFQSAQSHYSRILDDVISTHAPTHGAEVDAQASSGKALFGTDTDKLVKMSGPNVVKRINGLRTDVNEHLADLFQEHLAEEHHLPDGVRADRLFDIDYMLDAEHATPEIMKQLSDPNSPYANNEAYERLGAASAEKKLRIKPKTRLPERFKGLSPEELKAERMRNPNTFEAITDADGNITGLGQPDDLTEAISKSRDPLTNNEIKDYTKEMVSKIDKYGKIVGKELEHPDGVDRAKLHTKAALQQKYIPRLDALDNKVRRDAGLPTRNLSGRTTWHMEAGPDGKMVLKPRHTSSLPSRAAKRLPQNFLTALEGYGQYDKSLTTAVERVAKTIIDAAGKDYDTYGPLLDDFGEITERLPPEARKAVIEHALKQRGSGTPVMRQRAANIAYRATKSIQDFEAAKKPTLRQATQNAINKFGDAVDTRITTSVENFARNRLGIGSDIAEMSQMRRKFNEQAGKVIGVGGMLMSAKGNYDDLSNVKKFITEAYKGFNAETEAESDKAFEEAFKAYWELAKSGGMAIVEKAAPTASALLNSYQIGYSGGRWVMMNTETGRRFEKWKADATTSVLFGAEKFAEDIGLETDVVRYRQRDRDEKERLKKSFWEALRKGIIKLKSGAKVIDISDMIEDDNIPGIRQWIEPGPNASEATIERLLGKKKEPEKPTPLELEAYGEAEQFGDDGLLSEDSIGDSGLFGAHGVYEMTADEEEAKRNHYRESARRLNDSIRPNYATEARRIENDLVRIEDEIRRRQEAEARERAIARQRAAEAQHAWEQQQQQQRYQEQQRWQQDQQRRHQEQQRWRQWQQQQWQWQQNQQFQQFIPQHNPWGPPGRLGPWRWNSPLEV